MKIEELKKYTQVVIKIIKGIKQYRGFYFQLEDGYVVANFCSNPKEGLKEVKIFNEYQNGLIDIEELAS